MSVSPLNDGSPLPSGWSHTTAGNFRRKRSETFNPTVAQEGDYELWSIPSHATGAPEIVAAHDIGSNKQHVAPGDVLISRINPRLNRTWVVGSKQDNVQIASTEWIVFPQSQALDSRFLATLLSDSRIKNFLAANASGVGGSLTRVRPELFDNILLPIPPLNEQQRIICRIEALFDEVDRGVESLLNAKKAIGLYRQSLLKSAFEGRLTADWRVENPEKPDSPGALSSRGWPWPTLDVKALLRSPLANGRSAKEKACGFPVLRLTAFKNGKIDLQESKEGDWNEDDAMPFLVRQGDIFISRGNGSRKLVGIAGHVSHEPMPVAFPDTMIRVRLDTSTVRPDYFVLAWNSPTVRQQIEMAARTTAGIYKINQGHIRGFVLPLPSLAEQFEIVRILEERLESVDTLQAEIDANLAKAKALRQSILKKAFSGQLVPQDRDDEPAAILLQRIEAENFSRTPKRATRKRKAPTA